MEKLTQATKWIPTFPDRLFATIFVLYAPKKGWAVVTNERTYQKIQTAEGFCNKFALRARKAGMRVEYALIAGLTMERAWELKPDYWKSELHMKFSETRQRLFQNMIEGFEPGEWSVLITPTEFNKRKEFWVAMPVQNKKINEDVEAFMTYSDWPVIPEASHAGIYAVEEIVPIELEQKRVKRHLKREK